MANTPKRVVVVGGGLAGAKTVEALRSQGFDGTLTLIADEGDLPYERPPLSKSYLHGGSPFDDAVVHPEQWYAEHDVDLRRTLAAMGIDRRAQQVTLADGSTVGWDKLVLATGAVPLRLDIPGASAAHYLRSHHESDVLRESFGADKKVVVIGAGWIGLEVAAAARKAGAEVTVLEAADLPLLAVLGPEMAEVFAQLHKDNGVHLRTGVQVKEIVADNDVAKGVKLRGDETIDADVVVIGIGVQPEDSLARLADLAVDNGILVDPGLRTSDPNIYAVGDVANHDHPLLRKRIRVEHWANALNQPPIAARGILGESDARYENLPYFFSDQYDLGMEYVGYAPPDSYDQVVVRGDTDSREFVAFWLDEERHVLASMNVNVWDVVDEVRPLITKRRVVDPEKLADTSVDYSDTAADTD